MRDGHTIAHNVYSVNIEILCLLKRLKNCRPSARGSLRLVAHASPRNRLPAAIIRFSDTDEHPWCLQFAAGLQSAGFPEHRQNVGGTLFGDSP
jgi:hypothetical protein